MKYKMGERKLGQSGAHRTMDGSAPAAPLLRHSVLFLHGSEPCYVFRRAPSESEDYEGEYKTLCVAQVGYMSRDHDRL